MAIDTQALAGQINAIYESTLGRPADVEGLMYYANAILSGGGTLADVQRSIAASPEAQRMQTAQPAVVQPAAVQPATPSGGGGLLSGANIDSQALAGQIDSLYQKVFGRASDVGGLKYYGNLVMSGGSLADVERSLRASPEAQGLLGETKVDNTTKVNNTANVANTVTTAPVDQTARVNALYQKVFGRGSDPGGLAYWSNRFNQGATDAEVEAAFRASPEFQSPGVQTFQKGIRTVPFGSQLMEGQVKQMAQYGQPAAQAGTGMGSPSLQGFLANNPSAAGLTPFQQSLQYQAALPSMIQPFNPADIPATYQQQLTPTPRLDISSTAIPGWLQTAINEQKVKDGATLTEQQKFTAANPTVTNSGLGPVVKPTITPTVTPTVTPGVTPTVTPSTTGGLLASNQISPDILNAYGDYLGRTADLPGASYWQTRANQGLSIADIIANISGSPEGLKYAPIRQANLAAAANPLGNIVPD
ncbi:Domain of unknown function DUF4214 [uncultured Caudovirales phage]|uniref:DUF4214 domain-containing protein n=1 Tax=uncultured Caudovirales phage TaxID=2100421 RepID=A0A6J5MN99_9CAUD|nr:Domain of unknown function DUF4214 [uncultured Caudovirales phage]